MIDYLRRLFCYLNAVPMKKYQWKQDDSPSLVANIGVSNFEL